MTKAILLVGTAIGDSPYYYLVEATAAEKIIGNDTGFRICYSYTVASSAKSVDVFSCFTVIPGEIVAWRSSTNCYIY